MIIQKLKTPEFLHLTQTIFHLEILIDHMIICEYENGKWGDVKLVPYGPIPFTP
jgi:branched-chain amino acid aminotransferase